MSSKWRVVALSDVLSTIIDYRGKTPPKSETGIAVLTAASVKDGRVLKDKVSYISQETYEKVTTRGFPQKGDVLITTEAPVGEVAPFPIDKTYHITRRIMALRGNEDVVDSNFLLYALLGPHNQSQLAACTRGSTVPRVLKTDITGLEFPLPPLPVQRQIGGFLAAIDAKISLNTQANQTLEQMAQAIFKSWFVDFDPVKAKMNGEQPEGMDAATASLFPEKLVESELGLIPEGWEVGDLSDLMDFNPQRTLKKGTIAPYLDMKNMPTSGHLALDIYGREMGSGTKFMNGDSLLARITPCLENGKSAYVDFLEGEQVGWGSTEYIVMRSKSDSYKYFSYYMARFEPLRKFAIRSMTGTSGRQRAQAKTIQTMPFVTPPLPILEKFDELIELNMKLIKRHGDENKMLTQLRDTLLPELLSGALPLNTALKEK